MASWFGDYSFGATVTAYFDTCDQSGTAVNPTASGALRCYKNDSTTFEAISYSDGSPTTGVHRAVIDTSSGSYTSGFFAPGNDYHLILVGATVDGQSVSAYIGSFALENRRNEHLHQRSVDSASSASSFVLDSGASSTDDFYNGQILVFTSGSLQGQAREVTDYVGSTRTITTVPFSATPSAGDYLNILGAA